MAELVGTCQEGELYLIELRLEREGFRKFLSSWLLRTGSGQFLIDTGPAAVLPQLLDGIKELGVNRVDAILLTHIHLDHAGAVGDLVECFPEARVLAHPKARRHLEDPARLWEGSVEVLGDLAHLYGPLKPVPREKLIGGVPGIRMIETPGHAPHHASFLWGEYIFAGEAAGVYLDLGDAYYLRPATPPKFFLQRTLASLDTLLDLAGDESILCFGHFGWARGAEGILELARQQLCRWEQIIAAVGQRLEVREEGGFLSLLREEVLRRDPLLQGFFRLEPDIQQREKYFLDNSLKGYMDYLSLGPF
ncbi:MAG: MBL fold metallo-hydrolase [Thermoanaerobacteraceae bacterium]|nr:MBL fold metallo-hydrolase [Thermoanaerobacteraceae bacterium]